ncbi:nickel transporter [Deinococcus maricopensis]|uniref:Nickel/cobalt efflux system n=1 Tax=Deinococcus maricopensis (strain DSM 21211 / LMG 22137 / NRRL B-23946 / LB-34) TaxID=709986 RepID=E8U427_DEIML|nr:nickel transporter [Deinococcus maricopensis]ADV65864.1 high-affinity nickel-transporter [Deinococcus maricopensis DSM 21211]
MDLAVLPLVFALGLRHGLDADHLAVIDGFARLRPSPWNGVLFALGHGGVVTLLAVGVHQLIGHLDLSRLSPYLFLGLAAVNLWRLLKPGPHTHATTARWVTLGPFTLGVLLAIGFETVTQLSALALAQHTTPLWLGLAFTLGMMFTDGVNGLLASRLQSTHGPRAHRASRLMGWLVVLVSASFGAADLAGLDVGAVATPLGAAAFAALIGLRIWSARDPHAGAAPA